MTTMMTTIWRPGGLIESDIHISCDVGLCYLMASVVIPRAIMYFYGMRSSNTEPIVLCVSHYSELTRSHTPVKMRVTGSHGTADTRTTRVTSVTLTAISGGQSRHCSLQGTLTVSQTQSQTHHSPHATRTLTLTDAVFPLSVSRVVLPDCRATARAACQ